MKRYRWLYLGLVITLINCEEPKKIISYQLHDGWEFKQEGSKSWKMAEVPGVIHTDLIINGIISHPWKGTNEKEVQWIENENWIYQKIFDVQQSHLEREAIDLVFEGLDTYAEVTLNDQLILTADNMFRTWRIDVKDLLRADQNRLIVRFLSPITVNSPKLDALGYELPAGSEMVDKKVSPFTRKAPYHFGWDWGPRLVTSGIWRPVNLEFYHLARIDNIQIIQKELSDSLAILEAVISVKVESDESLDVVVMDQEIEFEVTKGHNELRIPFEIEKPELWWPNGWGNQYQYSIPVSIHTANHLLDADTIKIGLRTVELIHEIDSIGKSFYFRINGEPLFARGANYIPQSHFIPSVKDEDYKKLIEDVKATGMNMLRVWGGGIYEDDLFYDLCDENGILVWQDFMFAGSMYPGDSIFVMNVEEEVVDNVKRLRNHTSIVHWNGNNEIEVAWKNWGWQKQYSYSSQDSLKIWKDYLDLFHNRIPSLLRQLDDRSYTTTSPLSNWGTPENFNFSSMHYWGVWHGDDDFEDYKNNVGRFMGEYGFQSFPDMETVAYFADSTEWNLASNVMKHHQKSYVGNDMITEQLGKYFNDATDFDDFVMKSQQTQAKAIQMAIDAHRLQKGHCWGSLFWQLNDCWPGPSWSAVDVFGRKKILFEELYELFAPVVLIPYWEDDHLIISIVNDSLEEVRAVMELTLYNEYGEKQSQTLPITCKKNGIMEVFRDDKMRLKRGEVKLIIDDKVVSGRTFQHE
ncbi:hypothetical protein [Ekhidna sp.]|uniref:glycoside hydrolase family 2 protein n=1 Tax=Ekhidna sp. TaxID=2608089 RepID=UPI0032977F78